MKFKPIKSVRRVVESSVSGPVRRSIWKSAKGSVSNSLWWSLRDSIWESVRGPVLVPLMEEIIDEV